MTARTASCSCGQLRIEVQGEPRGIDLCHCLACQRRTGSVFAALARFPAPFAVSGVATDHVRVGERGAAFRFHFCPICGTTLFHTEEGQASSFVSVAVGAFADPDFPPPTISVHDCRRHAGSSCRLGSSASSRTRTTEDRAATQDHRAVQRRCSGGIRSSIRDKGG